MSTEAIAETEFVRKYTKELHNNNAGVFAGAGLSMAAGYVDWKGLLHDIVRDLNLDPDKEHDLVTVAQYHCNKAGGSKTHLTQTILNHFGSATDPTKSHRILARLPIQTYWTTNYDKLIEKSLEDAKKVPDVKYTLKQLSVTRPDRDVTIYKMHGDVDHSADAIINRDDYESYSSKMQPFLTALRGDLVEKTFLFLGFSFTDPNIDYILSRVRVQFEHHQRHHYCIQKRVSKNGGESDAEFQYRQLKQDYFIRDLKRFSVYTVLVDNYSDIPVLLEKVGQQYKRSSVFISGSVYDYGNWGKPVGEAFLYDLSREIAAKKYRIITGFGSNVGGVVINGTLSHLHDSGKTVSDQSLVMRPFPQSARGGKSIPNQWTEYREAMIDYSGIALFVFGNKLEDGKIVLSTGMEKEFEICLKSGVYPLPIGATGFVAKKLWDLVYGNLKGYFPNVDSTFRQDFERIGDSSLAHDEIVKAVLRLLAKLQGS